MISEGYKDFQPKDIEAILQEYTERDIARDIIVILDTAKAFVDVMSKKEGSQFGRISRKFVLKGGTLILLAHTNKNPTDGGKWIPGGTSDIKDDFDCAYVMSPGKITEENRKQVVFDNIKRRGSVVRKAVYSYSNEDISYSELFESVHMEEGSAETEDTQVSPIDREPELVKVVCSCIIEGITSKTSLVDALRQRSGISKHKAKQFIDRYTGDDPEQHKWNYRVGERGKQTFFLLEQPE